MDREHDLRHGAALAEAVVEEIQDSELVQARREQICNAALELFLEKGFASTTVRDICARSGVNQASLYDYVANKNDILRRILNQVWFRRDVPTLPERLKADPQRPLRAVVREYLIAFWTRKRNGVLLAYRAVPHMQKSDRRAMMERETGMLSDLADEVRGRTGLGPDDPRAEVIANVAIFLSAYAPLRDWLHRDIPQEVVADTIARAIDAMVEATARDVAQERQTD